MGGKNSNLGLIVKENRLMKLKVVECPICNGSGSSRGKTAGISVETGDWLPGLCGACGGEGKLVIHDYSDNLSVLKAQMQALLEQSEPKSRNRGDRCPGCGGEDICTCPAMV